jgi:LPXTG-motif cell wall-anchored protein
LAISGFIFHQKEKVYNSDYFGYKYINKGWGFLKKTSLFTVTAAGLFMAGAVSVSAEEHNAEDILHESNEAMENLDSFSSVIDIDMSMGDGEEDFDVQSTVKQDVILDPLKIRQETTDQMPDGSGEQTRTSYITDEGYYEEDGDGGWYKIDEGIDANMYDPGDQMDEAMVWGDDLELEEENGYYVISYSGSGDELEDVMDQYGEELYGEEEGMEEMMDELDISHFSYELYVDQESYYLTQASIDLTMELQAEGMEVSMDQTMDMEFHNFNGVEDFDIPEEVLEEAVDIEEMIEEEMDEAGEVEEGDELPATATNQPIWTAAGLLLAAAAGGVLVMGRRTRKTEQ